MKKHADKFCPNVLYPLSEWERCETCELIERVRSDERQREAFRRDQHPARHEDSCPTCKRLGVPE